MTISVLMKSGLAFLFTFFRHPHIFPQTDIIPKYQLLELPNRVNTDLRDRNLRSPTHFNNFPNTFAPLAIPIRDIHLSPSRGCPRASDTAQGITNSRVDGGLELR